MDYIKNLKEAKVKVIPPKVMVLLSKYARALRKHNGVILKLNNNDVFGAVHRTCKLAGEVELQNLYSEILVEVNHIDLEESQKEADYHFDLIDIFKGNHYNISSHLD